MSQTIEAYLDAMDNPNWIIDAAPDHLKILIGEWDGNKEVTITQDDVIQYYLTDARNISSGIRTLAGHAGDWRPIDELAKIALDFFKSVDLKNFRQRCINNGLTPRF